MYVEHSPQRLTIALLALTHLVLVGASSPGAAAPSALTLGTAADPGASRALSIEARVEYQRRIEEVHWRHTTWPAANPGPKPPLVDVMPEAALRRKVDDALRKSAALGAYWQRPITAEQLQAEMERMARGTRHPELLRELFAALDDDPFVIAECLARPALADRLLRNWYAYDERFHGAVRAAAESAMADGVTASSLASVAPRYEEVEIELERDEATADHENVAGTPGQAHALRLGAEEWSDEVRRLAGRFGVREPALPEPGGVQARAAAAGESRGDIEVLFEALPVGTVSTLEESADGWSTVTVLVKGRDSVRIGVAAWPKPAFSIWWSASRDTLPSALDPAAAVYAVPMVSAQAGCTPDTWRISMQGPPVRRASHTAVWTGERMIVWGGYSYGHTIYLNTGGVYDPATDTWAPTSVDGAPTARKWHTAVWTGARMIVWGGEDQIHPLNTGGVYDPATDTWTPTAVDGAPAARRWHTAVWTGTRMIVYGGDPTYRTGGVYDPATDKWTPTAVDGAPSASQGHTAVWTGERMIVWGGSDLNTGGMYDPATDTWTPTAVDGAPPGRGWHTAVWTGTRMIVWGGAVYGSDLNTGGVYDPATDTWTPTLVDDAPTGRWSHTAVWTGARMIIWGGFSDHASNAGGVYDPAADSWTPTSVEGAPSARREHAAVWTGNRMIVWGGFSRNGQVNSGGVYDPITDMWTPTSTGGAPPSERTDHTAVWTGTQMIVWGGTYRDVTDVLLNTGGVYDAATDTWTATSVDGAPSERTRHTAVWTGARMVVWGGGYKNHPYKLALNTGGVYNPATDTWTPTSVGDAASERIGHTAVWTGSRMIVWGGEGGSSRFLNTGGVYEPSTDTWTPTSVDGAPTARDGHTAVWTGARMIVWGGDVYPYDTGGVYDPATDAWTPTSVDDAPTARWGHTAVSTGTRMIVWGGTVYGSILNTGGVYDPAKDTWMPTSVEGAPSARVGHTAVYTGSEMLVWGGSPPSVELGAYCTPRTVLSITSPSSSGRYETAKRTVTVSGTSKEPLARVSARRGTTAEKACRLSKDKSGFSCNVTGLAPGDNNVLVRGTTATAAEVSDSILIVVTEKKKPVVKITSPRNGTLIQAELVEVIGTASDTSGVASVTASSSAAGGGEVACSGTTSWRCVVPLTVGKNQVTVTAVDRFGNLGTAKVKLVYTP